MTPADWKRVEQVLRGYWGSATLRVDGYLVTLQLAQIKPLRQAIWVYVDGVCKGKWITEECEERRRFFERKVGSLISRKHLATYAKAWGKREARSLAERATHVSYRPYWTNFRALRRHLVKNNTSIEIVETS